MRFDNFQKAQITKIEADDVSSALICKKLQDAITKIQKTQFRYVIVLTSDDLRVII